jgi:hypothetical protein
LTKGDLRLPEALKKELKMKSQGVRVRNTGFYRWVAKCCSVWGKASLAMEKNDIFFFSGQKHPFSIQIYPSMPLITDNFAGDLISKT